MTDIDKLLTIVPQNAMEKAQHLVELENAAKQIKTKIDEYRAGLLEETKRLDVLSLKTGTYTISRVKKLLPKVSNFQTLKTALEEANIPYDTTEVFADHMKLTFKQLAEEGREMPGLDVAESEYIMVRVNKE